jgi:AcrR family transcriptional regulator
MVMRNERTRATRERILTAAAQLFTRDGIRPTSVDNISDLAGLTKVTLYKHFRSKDELIAEVLEREENQWRAWFYDRIQTIAQKPEDRLLAAFEVLEEWFRKESFRGSPFINTAMEVTNPDHPVHKVLIRHRASNREFFRSNAEAAGFANPKQVEDSLIMLFRGAIVSALLDHNMDAAQCARKTAEFILQAQASRV